MMTMYISPYRRMANLREAMDRALEESLAEKTTNEREMLLAVDVISDADSFTVNAFVPGLEADDLNIEILNNTVAIRGEFKTVVEGEVKYMTSELPAGRFARIVTFPVDVDASKVEATIKNGMLSLHIPKAEAMRPKTIKINVN
jgi:HSP20 family protein